MYKGNNVFIQKLLIFINMIILPVIIVLAWHFATSTGAMSTLILPRISTVLETLKEQLGNGTLTGDIGISLSRIAKGYALAVVVGILLGVLMGMNKFANRFFMLTRTGKYAARKITATLDSSPIPNQMIRIGTHAIIGI